jgi:hypothetical protein
MLAREASALWLTAFDERRHTNGNAVGRYIGQDDGIGPNQNVVADADVSQYLGASAYVHVVAKLRGAGLAHPGQANHNTAADAAVTAKAGEPTDDNAT